MRIIRFLTATVFVALLPAFTFAQHGSAPPTGTIIEESRHVFPEYDHLPGWTKRLYTRESYEVFRNSPDLELVRIKYMSGGLKVTGFIYKPRVIEGKKLPVIIYNRGGVGEDTKIGNSNFQNIYEMYRYASEGFVVLASQYRGVDGGEGRDEMGGADLIDVMSLLPLARSLTYVDLNRMYIWGFSRGAQMALQAIKEGLPVKAAVVVGVPTDWEASLKDNPSLIRFVKETWPEWEARKEEHFRRRSAILWADQIDVPLLILQGGADPAFGTRRAMEFVRKLDELGKLYEFIIYARDDHPVNLNREDRLQRTIDWFKNPRKLSIAHALDRTIGREGVEAAIKLYRDLRRDQPEKYDFSEAELNQLGYTLLNTGRPREAIEIFKLNAAAYPSSPNVFDSLGEAYMLTNERELAIINYQKSLELNPQNNSAVEALRKLKQK